MRKLLASLATVLLQACITYPTKYKNLYQAEIAVTHKCGDPDTITVVYFDYLLYECETLKRRDNSVIIEDVWKYKFLSRKKVKY